MLARLALFAAGLWASAALAEDVSPFAPPPPPPPKIVRLLAPPAMLDLDALQAFEAESGYQVAYDAYEGALDLAEKWREGPYDLVVLSGPALAREIAAGALARLDKARLDNARGVRPAALAKLAAYDPTGAYALPLGWYATGLVYDAGKAGQRIGGAPASWNALFKPGEARKMADCGVVLPDDRDALFVAAWRLLGVDPARATAAQVKSASAADRPQPQDCARLPRRRRGERAGERRRLHQRRRRGRSGSGDGAQPRGRRRRRHPLRAAQGGRRAGDGGLRHPARRAP